MRTSDKTTSGPGAARQMARLRRDPEFIRGVLKALDSGNARERFAAAKLLRAFSEKTPELLCPHFDHFAGLLNHANSILRWEAIRILANLAYVDRNQRLEGLLDAYLAPLRGPQMIAAGNVIAGAAVIARAKPHLAGRLARAVLGVESATYATPECRNVAIGHALRALGDFFDLIDEPQAVVAFAERQCGNPRTATRAKAARLFAYASSRGAVPAGAG